jgi:multiple sugar transport system ATP-binding protein
MDEPLSNLDAKLRVQMRAEISKLHKRLETTFVYVTHDQTEAMTMGDRIVVMYDGEIQQVASPSEIYDFPVNKYVAGFIGSPAMNFIDGKIMEEDGDFYFIATDVKFKVSKNNDNALRSKGYINKEVILGIRPEDFYDSNNENALAPIQVELEVVENMGSEQYLYVQINGTQLTAKIKGKEIFTSGEQLNLYMDTNKVHFFDKETEQAIR